MDELVFKRQCGRCPAVGEIAVTFDEIKKGKDPGKDKSRAMKIVVGGKTLVDHDYLCDACQEITARYIESIGRELEKRSSTRERRADDEE